MEHKKIGIGITTHNRRDVFKKTFETINRFRPEGAKLVVVDDCSDIPAEEADYRFETNVGIATAKNKCLEMLDDCEHIFLFDDDCFPTHRDWYVPYIESEYKHLMYIFEDFKERELYDCEKIYEDDEISAFTHPRGCMIYVHRSVLDIVGGMDTGYSRWGFEHGDWSNRIYNNGLTPFRYMDIKGSYQIIKSLDEYEAVKTTVLAKERRAYIAQNQEKYNESLKSKKFFPYKDETNRDGNCAILTSYFNDIEDPQRGNAWATDFSRLDKLVASVEKLDIQMYVMSNCFRHIEHTKNLKTVYFEQTMNPYIQRWFSYWKFLNERTDIEYAFCVDATDVEVLKNPFPEMEKGKLYVGSEDEMLGCQWIFNTTQSEALKKFVMKESTLRLMNGGLIGGSRELLMNFCRDLFNNYLEKSKNEITDMPIINYLCYRKYGNELVYGNHINSVFKKYENESNAWFKHK